MDSSTSSLLAQHGYDSHNVGALLLLPMFVVGWADGVLNPEELAFIEQDVRLALLLSDAAVEKASVWTQRAPTDEEISLLRAFLGSDAAVAAGPVADAAVAHDGTTAHELLLLAERLAARSHGATSGTFLGRLLRAFGARQPDEASIHATDAAELEALQRLEHALSVDVGDPWAKLMTELG